LIIISLLVLLPIAGVVINNVLGGKIMYKDKFVLTVLNNDSVLREYGPSYDRKVGIPFNSEYKIRLRNKNDVDCSARVFIDGSLISNFGDFIINSNSFIDLERFVIDSLDNGNKFKFVPLTNSNVNDPYSCDNGIIKVEFRLARNKILRIEKSNYIGKNSWYIPSQSYEPIIYDKDRTYFYDPRRFTYCSSNVDNIKSCCSIDENISYCDNISGSTVEGNSSNQSFSYSNIEIEDSPSVILKLKLVGINNKYVKNKTIFCTSCGSRRKNNDKFCGQCGHKH
jgi:hypothetical protein